MIDEGGLRPVVYGGFFFFHILGVFLEFKVKPKHILGVLLISNWCYSKISRISYN